MAQSETDPDSRIAKMKDGRTHLAYKAEHAVDLATGLILAATVYPANQADRSTVGPTLREAQNNLIAAESDKHIQEVVLDKGYYKHETLAELEFTDGLRTYVAEPKQNGSGIGNDKPAEQRQAIANNRRRIRGNRGRALQRQRSEKVEHSFAHVCQTGGARRTWLRGLDKVRKRHLMAAMAYNLGNLMRSLFGIGTARALQAGGMLADGLCFALFATVWLLKATVAFTGPKLDTLTTVTLTGRNSRPRQVGWPKMSCSTGW